VVVVVEVEVEVEVDCRTRACLHRRNMLEASSLLIERGRGRRREEEGAGRRVVQGARVLRDRVVTTMSRGTSCYMGCLQAASSACEGVSYSSGC
jgi:hypothetical protein